MANWESHDEEDDFFGTVEEDEVADHRCEDGHELNSGLAIAESTATSQHFQTIGFHETYEENKDNKLQEGFEAGYRENVDISMRIGELLGELTMRTRLKDCYDGHTGSAAYVHSESLESVRDYLISTENASCGDGLKRLEETIMNFKGIQK